MSVCVCFSYIDIYLILKDRNGRIKTRTWERQADRNRWCIYIYLCDFPFSMWHVCPKPWHLVARSSRICTSPRGILNAPPVNAGLFIYSSCAHNAYTHTSRIAMPSARPSPPSPDNTKPNGPPIKTDGDGDYLRGCAPEARARIFNFGGCSFEGDKIHLEITLRYEYDVTRIPDELSRARKLGENFHRAGYITLARR